MKKLPICVPCSVGGLSSALSASAHQGVVLPRREGTPGRSWSALETPQGREGHCSSSQMERLSEMSRSDQLSDPGVGKLSGLCSRKGREKRDCFCLGRAAERPGLGQEMWMWMRAQEGLMPVTFSTGLFLSAQTGSPIPAPDPIPPTALWPPFLHSLKGAHTPLFTSSTLLPHQHQAWPAGTPLKRASGRYAPVLVLVHPFMVHSFIHSKNIC